MRASKLDRVVNYHGSKYSLAPWILGFFPPHETFVDAFGGSGAMFCAKPPVPFEVYNDLGSEVVNFFRVLRADPEPLAHALTLTPWSREEWQRAWEPTEEPIERARRFLVRSWQNRGASACKTGWRYQRADTRGGVFAEQWGLLPPRLLAFASRMKRVQIEHVPFVDVIKRYDSPSTLIYADPPYLPTLRSTNSSYEVEMTAEEHERLASALYGVQGYCLVSGYRSDLYHDLYEKRGWIRKDKTVRTGSGSRAVESLWLCPRTLAARKQMELFSNAQATGRNP